MSDHKLSADDLSPDQREVYEAMMRWSETRSSPILTVGGYAGTGKTTLLSVFASRVDGLVAYATYTGRAASILKRKLTTVGVETTTFLHRAKEDAKRGGRGYYGADPEATAKMPLATTIHRLLYRPVIHPTTEVLRGWTKRAGLDRKYKLVVTDESSMIADSVLEDIRAHGVPVLAVGDHGQLPPVRAKGDLMKQPMLRLEKIHRQAEGSPIIAFSKHVREGNPLVSFKTGGDAVRFVPKSQFERVLGEAYALGARPLDVAVLCHKNRTRVKLNAVVRSMLGKSGHPRDGEPMVCLKNDAPVYNGMRGICVQDSMPVDEHSKSHWLVRAQIEFPDDFLTAATYELCGPQLGRETTFATLEELEKSGIVVDKMSSAGDLFDFGYAMTVHKSQGSQWPHVFVYMDHPEQPRDEMYRRLMYTAITRGAERVTVLW